MYVKFNLIINVVNYIYSILDILKSYKIIYRNLNYFQVILNKCLIVNIIIFNEIFIKLRISLIWSCFSYILLKICFFKTISSFGKLLINVSLMKYVITSIHSSESTISTIYIRYLKSHYFLITTAVNSWSAILIIFVINSVYIF